MTITKANGKNVALLTDEEIQFLILATSYARTHADNMRIICCREDTPNFATIDLLERQIDRFRETETIFKKSLE